MKCWAVTAKSNLRGANKLKALTEKFGERGFDYAGNSSADYAVWRGSREAVVVNASQSVLKEAARCTKLGPTFTDGYSSFAILKSVLNELFIRSGYLAAIVAGLLLAAAFPKIGIAGFAWVAPALLLFAAHGKNSGDAFRAGYVGGIAFWLASLCWLLLIPVAGLSGSWLAGVERVRGDLFWNLDVAARRKNRKRQLGATKSLVAARRGGVGRRWK